MKKLLILGIVATMLLCSIFSIISFASFNIESADLYSKGDCGQLIKKDGTMIVETEFVVYEKNGVEYPAYCLDKDKSGVGKVDGYTVSVESLENNVQIWKAITNGYPYKTPSELGCENEKEAYVATKMSVYTVIYGYEVSQFTGIGDAGDRVVKAIEKIVTAAKNNELPSKISSDLNIFSEMKKMELDTFDNKYASQTFEVSSKATMQNYTIKLTGKIPEGTKTTDENNVEKKEFLPTEKFKILIPIEQLGEGGEFKIIAKSGVETKPIFYGKAPNSSNQDYALTAFSYEDGVGEANFIYGKNETKLKIYKKDEETQEVLTGAKFDLLDSEKNVLYTNLISDDEGQILLENLLPGTYYLKETKAPTGYQLYDSYIQLDILFNEEISIIVNNKKEEKPKVEVEKKQKEVITELKKLPKTGM